MDPLLIIDVVAVVALLGLAMSLSKRADPDATSARRLDQGPEEHSLDSTLGHAELLVAWASGTEQDWDRHVRPILAREFEDRVGDRRCGSGARAATGELLFGPRLWALIDPTNRFTGRTGKPGPGRAALEEILERLEAA